MGMRYTAGDGNTGTVVELANLVRESFCELHSISTFSEHDYLHSKL